MAVVEIKQKVQSGGKELLLYRITNTIGNYVELLNYGASIVSVVVPDRNGELENVVLRYESLDHYLDDVFYLGSTVGRYANRISNAQFSLNKATYYLNKNDNSNSNHGGFNGFNTKIFNSRIEGQKLVFHTISEDGEGGFPGVLTFSVSYSLSEDNKLLIEYAAETSKTTPINFTNHAYFNLSATKTSALAHQLQVQAIEHLEMGDDFLPTGNKLCVKDSAFDFSQYAGINEMAAKKNDNLKGYNAYYMRNDWINTVPLASLRDTISGRKLEVYSSMPGIQFYTGDFLENYFIPHQGVCLEAQYYPDAINKETFEQCILEPIQKYEDWIEYVFSCYP